jgi:hypothetical protein
VVKRRPDPNREARSLHGLWDAIWKARLEMDEVADGMEARTVHGIAGAQALVEESGEHLDERAAEPRPAGGPDSDH